MKFILVNTLLLLPFTFSAPTQHFGTKLKRATGPSVKDSYIVVLKEQASRSSHIASISSIATDDVNDRFEVRYDDWEVLNGYAAHLGSSALERVLNDPDVDYVEEDGIVSINFDLDEREPVAAPIRQLAGSRRDSDAAGEGVDIYSIDTGVYIKHQAFGGRATWGKTFGGYKDADGHGHGTHTMGIAAGEGYGPATAASIIAVKVLDDQGGGRNSDVVSGINFVTSSAKASGKPSVANMSLGGNAAQSVDTAVQAALDAGVHFTAAAGNDDINASGVSPARVPDAVTVGAISQNKMKASWSNFGATLDVWYYGVSIVSTWNTSPTATKSLSGTSMAAPGVAGILAVEISKGGNRSPKELASVLTTNAIDDVQGAPSGTTKLRAIVW